MIISSDSCLILPSGVGVGVIVWSGRVLTEGPRMDFGVGVSLGLIRPDCPNAARAKEIINKGAKNDLIGRLFDYKAAIKYASYKDKFDACKHQHQREDAPQRE